ncbi:endo mannanase, GH76 family [Aspergillus campestris IBT 28561]|uniref:Mannan endo-1,6-alpha-mannosidase n=1 Tax=Aspergillus campestris (strain IBT 28561) TaxID=1392248 RepID=A0A2I1D4X5_ASPC2|nr:endo mannanase, GH76 family [Aspergillus campestris IBT 28561]PKY04908.1 endo mannanase, GH76 family [Aspergillus campestris IBT 28561]
MKLSSYLPTVWLAMLLVPTATAIDLDIQSDDSLRDAASTAAWGMMHYYKGNESGQTPGKLDGTWWEAGIMFMHMIEYWRVTDDDTYNAASTQGMVHQSGDKHDYMPDNATSWLGNDDQMFWGLAAITAAEMQFPDPKGGPSWLSLAQAVYNTQIARWDMGNCGGGLRWQMWNWLPGWELKNSVSNGGLFHLAARLAMYTDDKRYKDWAIKIWDWSASTPLLNDQTWHVADTVSIDSQCKESGNEQWTYNYGHYMTGAAYLYNLTNGDEKWLKRVNGLLDYGLKQFYPLKYDGFNPNGQTMVEVYCEKVGTCDNNMKTYKSLYTTWLAFVTQIVPSTAERIIPKLESTAQAAARSCTGPNNACGQRWYKDKYDGSTGMEQQMSALGAFLSNLIVRSNKPPVSAKTGGDSKSDPNAGSDSEKGGKRKLAPITTGDKAGAAVLTIIVGGAWIGLVAWLFIG